MVDFEGRLPIHRCFVKDDAEHFRQEDGGPRFGRCFFKLLDKFLSSQEDLEKLRDLTKQDLAEIPRRRLSELISLSVERMTTPRIFFEPLGKKAFTCLVSLYKYLDTAKNLSSELSLSAASCTGFPLLHTFVSGAMLAFKEAPEITVSSWHRSSADMLQWVLDELPSLNLNGTDRRGWTALDYTRDVGGESLAAVLEPAGAQNGLFWAVSEVFDSKAHMVLNNLKHDQNANVNAKNEDGDTLLHMVLRAGHVDAAEILLAAGADVTAKNSWGETPGDALDEVRSLKLKEHLETACKNAEEAFNAARSGQNEKLQPLLMEGKVSPSATDAKGHTLLDVATRVGNYCGEKVLEKFKVPRSLFWAVEDATKRSKWDVVRRWCMASYSMKKRGRPVLKDLLKALGDPLARDGQGNTALHLAVSLSDVASCELLLVHGVGLEHHLNRAGHTPMDPVLQQDHVSLHTRDLAKDVAIRGLFESAHMVRAKAERNRMNVESRRAIRQGQFDSRLQTALNTGGAEALDVLMSMISNGISQDQIALVQKALMKQLQENPEITMTLAAANIFKDKPAVIEAVRLSLILLAENSNLNMDPRMIPQLFAILDWADLELQLAVLQVMTAVLISQHPIHREDGRHLIVGNECARFFVRTGGIDRLSKAVDNARKTAALHSAKTVKSIILEASEVFNALVSVKLPDSDDQNKSDDQMDSEDLTRERFVLEILSGRDRSPKGNYEAALKSFAELMALAESALAVGGSEELCKIIRYEKVLITLRQYYDIAESRGEEFCDTVFEALQEARQCQVRPQHSYMEMGEQALQVVLRKLVQAAMKSEDLETMEHALERIDALEEFNTKYTQPVKEDVEILDALLKDQKEKARDAAMLAERMQEAEEQANLLNADDAKTRRDSCRALGKLSTVSGKFVANVVQMLKDPDSEVRAAACQTLGQLGEVGKQYAQDLAELLLDPEAEVIEAASLSLNGMGDAGAEACKNLLQDPAPSVRRSGAHQLGVMGKPGRKYADLLASLLTGDVSDYPKDGNEGVREAAVTALGKMEEKCIEHIDAVGATVRDEEPQVCVAAVTVLSSKGTAAHKFASDISKLLSCFDHPEAQKAAEEALPHLGQAGAAAAGELLKDPDQRVRTLARTVLNRTGIHGARVAAELLLDKDANIKSDAEFSLGKMGLPGSQAVAELAIDDGTHGDVMDLRRVTSKAILARFGNKGTTAVLHLLEQGMEEQPGEHKEQVMDGVKWILSNFTRKQAGEVSGIVQQNDEKMKKIACVALTLMGDVGTAAIATLLKSDDPAAKAAAASALSEGGEENAKALCGMLQDDDTQIQEACMQGLLRMGEVGAQAAANMLANESPAARAAAAKALGTFGEVLGAVHAEAVVSLLGDGDDTVREAAETALSQMGTEGARVVSTLLITEDAKTRSQGATILGNYGAPHADKYASQVSELLKDDEVSPRLAAEGALIKFGQPGIDAVMEQLGESSDVEVRSYAISVLGRMGRAGLPVESHAIASFVQDEDPKMRLATAEAIGSIGERAAEHAPAIARLLQDSDPRIRPAAATALSLLGAAGAQAVTELLKDDDAKLREAATSVLSRMGDVAKEHADSIAQLLWDSDSGVKSMAEQCLSKLGESGVAALTTRMRKENVDGKTLLVCLDTMRKMVETKSVEEACKNAAIETLNSDIQEFLKHKNAKVRVCACNTICTLASSDVLDPVNIAPVRRMLKELKSDSDKNVAQAAVDATGLME
eukprot:gnl/MRDRNA2_/MRDRNA2_34924_c0_seq1.p1 gnl/MRDRNA2_/MRDRNA2_34924_c0~~gnl/MRDRNA2_/MRDRNA2_34924_c0_seq1.p1  ORF type:complete len:2021 (+),score=473.89 gnl/MRDRNA2_/MRDRNA2_34924_c0_seq1:841-6063(+)